MVRKVNWGSFTDDEMLLSIQEGFDQLTPDQTMAFFKHYFSVTHFDMAEEIKLMIEQIQADATDPKDPPEQIHG